MREPIFKQFPAAPDRPSDIADYLKAVDEFGRAYASSQFQIQIYVNRRSEDLSQKVIQGLPDLASLPPRLHWVSPLKKYRCV